jgi:serine/threonine-protein kinase
MAYAVLAGYELEHGRDPRQSLDSASKAIDAALGQNRNDAQAQLYHAEILGVWARFQTRQGNGKAESFAAAADAFQKAIDAAPENQDIRIAFGDFCRAWAAFQSQIRTNPKDVLQRGLSLVQPVLDRRPTWPDALVLRASLTLALAQDGQDAAETRQQAESARNDLADALSANHMLSKLWASQASRAQQLAAPR